MKQQPAIISIIGKPGAGKTTLGMNLARIFCMQHVSGGDVARRLAEEDEETRERLAVGEIAPEEKMNTAMKQHLLRMIKLNQSLVVDGYPRYEEQYLDLVALHQTHNFRLIFVGIECSDYDARLRLLSRQRSDDSEAVISNRMKYFADSTYPLFGKIHIQYRTEFCTFYTGSMLNDLMIAGSYITRRLGVYV